VDSAEEILVAVEQGEIGNMGYFIFWTSLFIAIISTPPLLVHAIERKKNSWKQGMVWIWIAGGIIALAIALSYADVHLNTGYSNFLLHFFGGGVVSVLWWRYFNTHFLLARTWLQDFMYVWALVCMMGVANELFEFFLDSTLGYQFSFDRYDTWWDLVANSLGAIVGWVSTYSFEKNKSKNNS
jgi:hypothetical protein